MDDIDFIQTLEQEEKDRNLQCYKCGGWAIECPCEDN